MVRVGMVRFIKFLIAAVIVKCIVTEDGENIHNLFIHELLLTFMFFCLSEQTMNSCHKTHVLFFLSNETFQQ